eukprot:CAMPEP_0171284020 /NCGR_PEP_ID=MMETSP0790-20130122/67727_1 /TAXON_ID=2925 /ORGANISM="Alexandrium catenella, Strain OF101" /LENGTH=85 /DNA_ID=CAMNT_0011753311 /DNA_START=37 /DNA_END=291 /DNA_ORIENTATION=-
MSTMMAYPGQMGQMMSGQQVYMVFPMPMVQSGGHQHGGNDQQAWVPMAMPVNDASGWGNGEHAAGMASQGHPQMWYGGQQPQQVQ